MKCPACKSIVRRDHGLPVDHQCALRKQQGSVRRAAERLGKRVAVGETQYERYLEDVEP